MRLRPILAVVTAFGLSACNNVVSVEPWFTEADTQGAPALRDGLWVMTDAECRFNEAKPAERWPGCALPFVVRGDEWLTWGIKSGDGDARKTSPKWNSIPVVVAAGQPMIMQIEDVPEPVEEGPDVIDLSEGEPPANFYYRALRPIAFDPSGKLIRFGGWMVECGPLPKPTSPEEELPYVTDEPFRGLIVSTYQCTAENEEALRNAAALSETLDDNGASTSRWIREGWR